MARDLDRDQFRMRLLDALKASGLTRIDLAKAVGIDVWTVHSWMSGKYVPSLCIFPALCETLGVPADWLLGIEWEDDDDV